MLSTSRRTTAFLSLTLACILLDQVTKHAAQSFLSTHPTVHLLDDTVRLQLIFNNGGIAGIGAGSAHFLQPFFIGWNICLLGVIVSWGLVSRGNGPLAVIAAGLVFSGGLGNILDRLLVGGVVDFISLNFFGLRTAVFNLADIFILSGFAVLLVSFMRDRKTLARRQAEQGVQA